MSSEDKKTQDSHSGPSKSTMLMVGTILILVLTIVSFVFVPAFAGQAGNGNQLTFGRYGKHEISYMPGSYFNTRIENINSMYNSSGDSDFSVEQKMQVVWRAAFEETMLHYAALDAFLKSGMVVTEDKIDKIIINYPMFQQDGEFSPALYKEASSAKIKEIRNQLKENIAHQQYMDDLFYLTEVNEEETGFLLDMGKYTRKFRFAALSYDAFPPENIEKFFKSNRNLFKQRNFSRISITGSEKEARQILEKSNAEESSSFQDLARRFSKDSYADKGGDMGTRYAYELAYELPEEGDVDVLMNLSDGEISDVMKTSFGWAIYKADTPLFETSWGDETEELVLSYLKRNRKDVIENFLNSQAEEFTAKARSNGFTSAAESMGINVKTTDFFPVNYGPLNFVPSVSSAVDHPAFSRVYTDLDFFKKAFSLKKEEVSAPMTLNNHVVVLQFLEDKESEGFPQESKTQFAYYVQSQIIDQYKQNDLKKRILDSEKAVDNFYTTLRSIQN